MHEFISELDSERFGFPVAKMPSDLENPELTIQNLKILATKLVITRVDLKNILMINRLEKLGFLIKDTQLTYNYNLTDSTPRQLSTGLALDSYKECYLKQLINVTKESFNNYGHYFADEKLDRKKCLEVYTDWIRNCCYDKSFSDKIIIAKKDSKAIGYLALKLFNESSVKYAAGVIGAVAPEHRKGGVFQAINIESLNWAKIQGCTRVENNVLATNFPVQNAYINLKYKIIRSEVTMHYWFNE
jgi:hypothetical protein